MTREKQEVVVVIYKAVCSDVPQGHVNGAPNENQIHSLVLLSNHYIIRGSWQEVVVAVVNSMSRIKKVSLVYTMFKYNWQENNYFIFTFNHKNLYGLDMKLNCI